MVIIVLHQIIYGIIKKSVYIVEKEKEKKRIKYSVYMLRDERDRERVVHFQII